MTKYLGNEITQHRNFREEKQITKEANSEIVVRPMTEEERKKFEQFKPELKEGRRWTERN